MLRRSYYLMLGVLPNESTSGVRSAFAELVRRYHPDRVGPRWQPIFQAIVQAYQVLSDPQRRRCYDLGLSHGDPRIRVFADSVPVQASEQAEPLVPRPAGPFRLRLNRHAFEAAITRVASDSLSEHNIGAGDRLRGLETELVLSPGQAARGGVALLSAPACWPCPSCGGSGHDGLTLCAGCRGVGLIEEEETVRVCLPPMIEDGTVIELPLRGLGVHDFYLRLRVVVGGH